MINSTGKNNENFVSGDSATQSALQKPTTTTDMDTFPTLSSAEIRASFLDYFKKHGAKVFPSSSLIPEDSSLLLTNAGMNQFKQYFLGTKTLQGAIGATSCQKCLRTNDIDVIGLDGRHLSFFEMLGNFSFGGYSKRQACDWALDFCLNVLCLPLEKLYFTIFERDDEAEKIWTDLGVSPDHITRLGEEDNFWAAGPTGPCGPCSEIYFDQGPSVGCGKNDCAPGCDCDRFLEFWNLVFTQYDRQEDGTLVDLPHQNVDTGMGLERIAAIMQHKVSNYDGDILHHLIELAEKLSGKKFGENDADDASLRIIADHSRAVTFMIADGILPSNEGRGYVLRRLLRRAIFHGRLLGIAHHFLVNFVAEITNLMGDTYSELIFNASLIDKTVTAEEDRFQAVIETGQNYLEEELDKLENSENNSEACENNQVKSTKTLSGEVAFTLHDTYGFPLELTKEIAQKRGFSVDEDAFKKEMDAQKERARKAGATEIDAWKNVDIWTELSEKIPVTEFLGYETTTAEARVLEIVDETGRPAQKAGEGRSVSVVLDKTPFYAERGGQVADTGVFEACAQGEGTADRSGSAANANVLLANVKDVQDQFGLYAHKVKIEKGTIAVGDTLVANVDVMRRALIERNHTATHLLDAALMEELGSHVHQAGSFVGPDRLRFDFTHFEALSPEQLKNIERKVNEAIAAALPVHTDIMDLEEAKAAGAVAQFSEKYADTVRVVLVRKKQNGKTFEVSKELCGGTHAKNTAELGLFKITGQSSVGAAARRIEALTSLGALSWVDERLDVLDDAAAQLKVSPLGVGGAVADARLYAKEMKKRLSAALSGKNDDAVVKALGAAIQTNCYQLVLARLDGRNSQELRGAWDQIKKKTKEPTAAFLISETPEKKVVLLAAGTDDAVKAGFNAGDLIKKVAQEYGGRGGGRENMAQGGIEKATDADSAMSFLRNLIQSESDASNQTTGVDAEDTIEATDKDEK